MKKVLVIVLCLAMVFGLSACGKEKSTFKKTAEYYIDSFTIELPETYVEQDLKEVQAANNCIAMLKDSSKKLPNLWIYKDTNNEETLWDYILEQDKTWNYDEITLYGHEHNFAKTIYKENWYGDTLYNVQYYKIEGGNTVLSFDFACDYGDQHYYLDAIEDIAELLDF